MQIVRLSILISLAILPVIVVLYWVYKNDLYEKESTINLLITFILGCSICYPVVLISKFMAETTNLHVTDKNPLIVALSVILTVALVEEGMKFLVLRMYNYQHEEFTEPYDGVMYAVAISLGFAAVENILYSTTYGYATCVARMFTAVPAHGVFGVVMGAYTGIAKFTRTASIRKYLIVKGFVWAVLFHAGYDFFILLKWGDGMTKWASFTLLLFGLVSTWYYVRRVREVSPYKYPFLFAAAQSASSQDDNMEMQTNTQTMLAATETQQTYSEADSWGV